jgi:hypothetical protein
MTTPTTTTQAQQAADRLYADAAREARRWHLPGPRPLIPGLGLGGQAGGWVLPFEDGTALEVRPYPAAVRYGVREDGGRAVVTCTTPDGVTADALFTRTAAAAEVVAATLNADGGTPDA